VSISTWSRCDLEGTKEWVSVNRRFVLWGNTRGLMVNSVMRLWSEQCRDGLPHSVTTILKAALGRAKQIDDAAAQAWALREGMDSAFGDLQRAASARSSVSEDKERVPFTLFTRTTEVRSSS
jgi:hypothetical protein